MAGRPHAQVDDAGAAADERSAVGPVALVQPPADGAHDESQQGAAHAAHSHHQEIGFWRTYIFSTDHKMIGRQFLFMGLLMLIVGGLLAMMVRWQLAWPEAAPSHRGS